jgi:putative ABC transport system permease protein
MAIVKNKTFINKIIKHYLKYDKDNPFIFISSILALLGIAVGIMVLMIAIGIMNGTQEEFKKRLFVMDYPLTINPVFYRSANDDLVNTLSKEFPNLRFSPYYRTPAVSKSNSNIELSVLFGVNFEKEKAINEVFAKAQENSLHIDSKFKVVTGGVLLKEMQISKGEKLTLNFFKSQTVGFGTMPFLQKKFTIDSSYKSGLSNYDKVLVYTTHEAFHKILKREKGVYDGIHIYSANAEADIKRINTFLDNSEYAKSVSVEGWWEQKASYFAAMEMEKNWLGVILLLIVVVASVNIISSLLMTVMSRRSEIALMKTLGATSKEIESIFFRLGTIIGIAGIITGVILAIIVKWILTTFPIISLSEDVYGFSKLPIELGLFDFSMIIIGAFIIVIVAAIYPAKKASSTDPLTILRNE